MKRITLGALAAALAAAPLTARAQGMGEANRKIENGGIFAPGWQGKIDPSAARRGSTLNDARFAKEGNAYHVTTGPATTYWNPANVASGEYTVKATFTEPKFMNRNDHAHPYGIVIAGNAMGTDKASFLYCAAYGTGYFIVRGFGPNPFQMNGREGEMNAAVHKAAGPDQPVTQDIAMTVTKDKVECTINGTVVASYPKSALVTAGKLASTDGVYGIRFAHNTDGVVTNLTMTKH